ncbi:protein kinase [Streptomyces sp. NBC_01551]|uniref:serine/threonine protein kinase n=1 Tax=Streptomyces sp. NBC_01551 TaxID=2975876 RepID=UPI002258B67F|nr:serine/threonine protein kinase [Streptomyces sp. NBC_01551]MCX4527604.1 protein kinase [Streptomyces sp. NBC_01551]
MSKPEHTESPEPSVGAGSPAAKPGASPRPPKPTGSTGSTGPAGPDLRKAAPAEPEDAKPAAAGPGKAAPAAAKSAAAADASAEPEDAKPAAAKTGSGKSASAAGTGGGSAKPGSAKPTAAGPSLGKGAPAEPEDAKPAPSGLNPGKAAPAEPEDAKPAAAKAGAGKPGSAASSDAKPAAKGPNPGKAVAGSGGGNPVAEKADAVAAEVKARAEAAKAAGNGQDKGRLLAGRYRLGAVLGKGGMGTVWRAEDETLGRTVAVKELRFSTGVDEDEKRRLITRTLREAKAIARIRSGGAVTVYDVVDEDGRPWIVMELIEGPSLAEFIRERGTLTPRRAAEVGLAVLDVLRAAHGQGILHRDVKPSNVLIAGNGRVVLTDFGIAQVEGDPSVTSTGMLVGAPSYISPERARGQRPGPPADMWSLGGLLYAAVEGVPPYDKGSALATLTAVMTEPVDPPKNAGPLTEVIYGLLAKDPARRLDDERARAMLNAVVNAPDEPEPAPEPVPSPEETRQISLVEAKQAAEKIAGAKAAEKAEKAEKKERERREREQRERARAALKAARKAAAVPAASAAEPPAPRPTAPVAASLTDVMPRRTIALAIAGLVVVLAVIGSLLVYAFSGDDSEGRKNEGKGGATPSASGKASPGGADGSAKGGGDAKGGGEPGTGQSPSAQQSSQGQGQGQVQGQSEGQGQGQGQSQGQGASPGTPGGALPAGYTTVTDPRFHFSMAMPEGFHQTDTAGENSGAIYSRDGGFPRIQVDFNARPLDDARAAWASLAPAVAGSSKNYKVIRIDSVKYRDYPTVADWEFERDQKGIRVRVLNRGFKADSKHGYAIMISCAADEWDGEECTRMRETAFETFQILG